MTAPVSDLYHAVFSGDVARARAIADAENVNTHIHHRASPFHMACFNGDAPVCEILLGRGADLRASGPLQEFGDQPVTGLDVARARGHNALVDSMERLLADDAPDLRRAMLDRVAREHGLGEAPADDAPASEDERLLAAERLYNAIVAGDRAGVWALAQPWNINVELHHYGTPFHLACFKGNREMIDALLEAGADLTKKARLQEFGEELPEQIAARSGHDELARHLAQRRAS